MDTLRSLLSKAIGDTLALLTPLPLALAPRGATATGEAPDDSDTDGVPPLLDRKPAPGLVSTARTAPVVASGKLDDERM